MDEMILTDPQWEELSASVAAGDRAKVQRQLAALFIVYRQRQIAEQERVKRLQRSGRPWIPEYL